MQVRHLTTAARAQGRLFFVQVHSVAPMRAVYQAENLFDAHLVRGRLASEGVNAVVTGEYLAGAMGELPVAGLLAVWVDDDDCPAALELLAAWQAESAESIAEAERADFSDDLRDQAFLA